MCSDVTSDGGGVQSHDAVRISMEWLFGDILNYFNRIFRANGKRRRPSTKSLCCFALWLLLLIQQDVYTILFFCELQPFHFQFFLVHFLKTFRFFSEIDYCCIPICPFFQVFSFIFTVILFSVSSFWSAHVCPLLRLLYLQHFPSLPLVINCSLF